MKRSSRSCIEVLTLTGLLCLAISTTPAAAVTGYSIFDNRELTAIDLATGAAEVIGDLAIGTVSEIAFDGADLFVVAQIPPTSSLYRIDRKTGTETPVGDLGNHLAVTGLTFDAAGTLWMSTADALYTVDPESAATTRIGTPDRPLLALAARGRELFGLAPTDVNADLVTIDPETAVTSIAAELPETFFNGGLLAGLAFDLQGSLWAYAVTLPPIEPHILLQSFYQIGDPNDPQVMSTFFVEAPFIANPPLFNGLVVAPGVFEEVVEVPALDRLGWTMLVAMLLGAGLMTLRRHRDAA